MFAIVMAALYVYDLCCITVSFSWLVDALYLMFVDTLLFSREDWKPVLTINSIVYGLQFLFLVSLSIRHLLLPVGLRFSWG